MKIVGKINDVDCCRVTCDLLVVLAEAVVIV